MRSIILALSVTSLAATGAAAAPRSGAAAGEPRCVNDPTKQLARPGKSAQLRKLTELPPADAYLAVLRRGTDGCIVPIKMNYRYGKQSERSTAKPPRR